MQSNIDKAAGPPNDSPDLSVISRFLARAYVAERLAQSQQDICDDPQPGPSETRH